MVEGTFGGGPKQQFGGQLVPATQNDDEQMNQQRGYVITVDNLQEEQVVPQGEQMLLDPSNFIKQGKVE